MRPWNRQCHAYMGFARGRVQPLKCELTCLYVYRCQYAQLAQQPFAPPRGWRLPPPNHPDLPPAERGLKITAGFEILMARWVGSLGGKKGGGGGGEGKIGALVPRWSVSVAGEGMVVIYACFK